jgi:hypothetical protein
VTRVKRGKALAEPCKACPWLADNFRKDHPDGWYTLSNLRRLWRGLRRGEPMSCHPTDPGNPVGPDAVAAGYRAAPEGAKVKLCAGAAILQGREFMRWQDDHQGDTAAYRKVHPKGLTKAGAMAIAARLLFGRTPFATEMPDVDLNARGVEFVDLAEWETRTEGAPADAG